MRLSKKEALIGIDLQGFIRVKNDDGTLIDSVWEEKEKIFYGNFVAVRNLMVSVL